MPSFGSLARAATGALALTPALLVLGIGLRMAGRARTLSVLRSPDFTYADVDDVFSSVGTTSLVAVTLFAVGALAGAVAFIAWLYRARRNLDGMPDARPRWSPGWTVAGWFIPVLNLVLPYLVVVDIVRESAPPARSRLVRLVGAWWLVLVAWLVFVTAGVPSSQKVLVSMLYSSASDPVDEALRSQLVAQVGDVAPPLAEIAFLGFCAVAAVLAILLVRRVTALQATALDHP